MIYTSFSGLTPLASTEASGWTVSLARPSDLTAEGRSAIHFGSAFSSRSPARASAAAKSSGRCASRAFALCDKSVATSAHNCVNAFCSSAGSLASMNGSRMLANS